MKRDPGEWVPPGNRGRRMDGGKISRDDRWWPLRWWRTHWLRHRRRDGEWADKGGRSKSAGRFLSRAGGRRLTPAQRNAAAYREYLEARYQAADRATRGNAPSAYFTGRPRSPRTAPEELRDWFRDHGPNLTASEYAAQTQETTPGRYPY